MRAAGTPPAHVAGRGQDGSLQLHRGVVQSRPSPFWHPLSIPNRLRDADAQGDQNDLSDKPSTKPGQLQRDTRPRRKPTIMTASEGSLGASWSRPGDARSAANADRPHPADRAADRAMRYVAHILGWARKGASGEDDADPGAVGWISFRHHT